MYESHFGFSGTPFNLNPDPTFYFQSKGHGNALSYLRFGVYQGEGFVVVTGEIGAGKTTLVRTLLSELDGQKIVAAQIVSTQLEAGDLLRSVAIAFGIAPQNLSKAELIASIEAFLTVLVTQRKRALLVVDEAQNLQLQAIEELRMLSNFQLGNHALLQSFLVGQPELRTLLTSKPMEQFRQRVIASCHLGPMDAAETQAYVEHRLRKVGWQGVPAFDAPAFERVYRWTSGTPRRVNLLCNRLLLAAYLASATAIDGAQVDEVAGEVLAEVGESKAHLAPMAGPSAAEARGPVVPRIERPGLRSEVGTNGLEAGPILLVAATRTDDQKLAVLMQALQRGLNAPPLALVRIGDADSFAPNDDFHRHLGLEIPVVELGVGKVTAAGRIAEVIQAFEPVLELHEPSVVVVAGDSDAALACAIVANKRAFALVHADLALVDVLPEPPEANLALLARLSTRLDFVAPQGSAWPSGGLGADAVTLARSAGVDAAAVLLQAGASSRAMLERGGHALVDVDATVELGDRRRLTSLLSDLREASGGIPLVWPMRRSTAARLEALGLRTLLKGERIVVLGPLGFEELVAVAESSLCVLTDSVDLRTQAQLLGVPCLWMAAGRAPADEGRTETAAYTMYSKAALEASVRAVPAPARPVGDPAAPAGAFLAAALVGWLGLSGSGRQPVQRQLGS